MTGSVSYKGLGRVHGGGGYITWLSWELQDQNQESERNFLVSG
jgi:NADH:ubiquinone oxidoreductase subunit F (NADH-binding)